MMKETYKSPTVMEEASITNIIPAVAVMGPVMGPVLAASAAAATIGYGLGKMLRGGSDAMMRCKMKSLLAEP